LSRIKREIVRPGIGFIERLRFWRFA